MANTKTSLVQSASSNASPRARLTVHFAGVLGAAYVICALAKDVFFLHVFTNADFFYVVGIVAFLLLFVLPFFNVTVDDAQAGVDQLEAEAGQLATLNGPLTLHVNTDSPVVVHAPNATEAGVVTGNVTTNPSANVTPTTVDTAQQGEAETPVNGPEKPQEAPTPVVAPTAQVDTQNAPQEPSEPNTTPQAQPEHVLVPTQEGTGYVAVKPPEQWTPTN